ncbi:MAG TPA: hypothetical protein VEY88_00790 [Archangium sp.]|nr:hypothetical protein [Archangium sp.]
MTDAIYHCSMEDLEHPVPDESIRARDPRHAAAMYKLTVSSKNGKPGNIVIKDRQGQRTVFSWGLEELRGN